MKILASLGLSSDLSGSWTWARLGEEQSPSLIFRLHHQPGGFWECWAETHWHTVREKWKHRFTASDKSLVFIGVRTVQMDTDLWPSGVRTSLRYSYVRKYRPLEGTSETEMERETVTPLNLGSPQLLCSRSHNTVTHKHTDTQTTVQRTSDQSEHSSFVDAADPLLLIEPDRTVQRTCVLGPSTARLHLENTHFTTFT